MSDYAILDADHNVVPISDVLEWARQFDRMDRHVARTHLRRHDISTVFIGANLGFGGPDLWFETIVFGGERDEQYPRRYATYAEAMEGHRRTVLEWLDKEKRGLA